MIMTHKYTNMIHRVLDSSPRDEDLLIALCENLQWGLDINHAKGMVAIDMRSRTVGFKSVSEALIWFRRSGNIMKVKQ
jgi:hypothetical protein